MSIAENIESVQDRIAAAASRSGRRPEEVTLVAVSKGQDAALVREGFEAGLRIFGENRVQEAQTKMAALEDIRGSLGLHMVGHLQTNKVKTFVQVFDAIQSVDSVHLGEAIDRRAQKGLAVFLEVNVSGEETKSGLEPALVSDACERLRECPHLDIKGLMTMAPEVADPEAARPVFCGLREMATRLGLSGLSMGMTNDFEVAIEEGATVIRVGTAIFGQRPARW